MTSITNIFIGLFYISIAQEKYVVTDKASEEFDILVRQSYLSIAIKFKIENKYRRITKVTTLQNYPGYFLTSEVTSIFRDT